MYTLIGSDFSDIILVIILSQNRYLILNNCLQAFKGYQILNRFLIDLDLLNNNI